MNSDDGIGDRVLPLRRSRGALSRVWRNTALRYLFIGGASFLIDVGLLALLHEVFSWPLWLATGTAFLSSFVFNYAFQRAFSFKSGASHLPTLTKYVALLAFNTLATMGIVALADATAAGWTIGKVVATAMTTTWTYFLYRHWVFADSSRSLSR